LGLPYKFGLRRGENFALASFLEGDQLPLVLRIARAICGSAISV
jgi:hypothetical protein